VRKVLAQTGPSRGRDVAAASVVVVAHGSWPITTMAGLARLSPGIHALTDSGHASAGLKGVFRSNFPNWHLLTTEGRLA